jgi:hypothetical protein
VPARVTRWPSTLQESGRGPGSLLAPQKAGTQISPARGGYLPTSAAPASRRENQSDRGGEPELAPPLGRTLASDPRAICVGGGSGNHHRAPRHQSQNGLSLSEDGSARRHVPRHEIGGRFLWSASTPSSSSGGIRGAGTRSCAAREVREQGYAQSRSTVGRFIAALRQETGQPHKFKRVQAASLYSVSALPQQPLTPLQAARWLAWHPCQRSPSQEQ